jgi:hypothetical protein
MMAANGLSAAKQQSNGKWGIVPAKKICSAAIGGSHWPNQKLQHCNWGIAPAKRKFAARQLGDQAGLLKNCGVAIKGLRRPLD